VVSGGRALRDSLDDQRSSLPALPEFIFAFDESMFRAQNDRKK
jgi:hypothetical protein